MASLALPACLPGDTREEPTRIDVTVEASGETRAGFTTDDGWTVTFDTFLVGMGFARATAATTLDGESDCASYYDAFYGRLFEVARTEGPRKVAEVYALGTCFLGFEIVSPPDDALLEPPVSEDEAASMRVVDGDSQKYGATSIRVRGGARRGEESKTFDWSFRATFDYSGCGDAPWLLESGESRSAPVVLHGEALFRSPVGGALGASPPAPGKLEFAPFADADADGDGTITMDELSVVETISFGDGGAGGGAATGWTTSRAGLLYGFAMPAIATIDGGACHGFVE